MRTERPLTGPERDLVAGMFCDAVDPAPVRLRHWRWWPLQPAGVTMAPMGHIHFTPEGGMWRDCFGTAPLPLQAFFLHEMTHVWQSQHHGLWYLPLMRHPFCRYDYRIVPGRAFSRYGIEQQASMVEHLHLLRHGHAVAGAPPRAVLEALLPFAKR